MFKLYSSIPHSHTHMSGPRDLNTNFTSALIITPVPLILPFYLRKYSLAYELSSSELLHGEESFLLVSQVFGRHEYLWDAFFCPDRSSLWEGWKRLKKVEKYITVAHTR